MRRYTKDDVETHFEYYRPAHPAVNVKAHNFPCVSDVVERFGCSRETAERALGWAFQMGAQSFWEDVGEILKQTLGQGTVYSEGRSSGWAVVHGLADVDDWDAVALGQWRAFETRCKAAVKGLCSPEKVLEDIDANRWAEENAEEYNFLDRDDKTLCLADVPRCAHRSKTGQAMCLICEGDGMSLGMLGNIEWLRCRACGLLWSEYDTRN